MIHILPVNESMQDSNTPRTASVSQRLPTANVTNQVRKTLLGELMHCVPLDVSGTLTLSETHEVVPRGPELILITYTWTEDIY